MNAAGRRRTILMLGLVLASVLAVPGAAPPALAQGRIYVGALYSGIHGPMFRFPSGYEELFVPQSETTPGYLAGFQYDVKMIGLGARAVYWHTAFNSFNAPEMPGFTDVSVQYSDPRLTHISFDMIVQWNALKRPHAGVYGLLGMAASTKKYTISGSDFPEWNGSQSRTNFDYSFGLGGEVTPVKPISLFAEVRWIPGDKTALGGDFLYSDGTYDYYTLKGEYTSHYTRLWSLGMSLNLWL